MRIITTATPELRPPLNRLGFLGLKRPKLNLRRSLAAFFVTVGEAFQLAYVAPYEARGRQSDVHRDDRI